MKSTSPLSRFADPGKVAQFIPQPYRQLAQKVTRTINREVSFFSETAAGVLFSLNEEAIAALRPLRNFLSDAIIPLRSKPYHDHAEGTLAILKQQHYLGFLEDLHTPDNFNQTRFQRRADAMKNLCPTSPAGWLAQAKLMQHVGDRSEYLNSALIAYHKMQTAPGNKEIFREDVMYVMEDAYRANRLHSNAKQINIQRVPPSSKLLGTGYRMGIIERMAEKALQNSRFSSFSLNPLGKMSSPDPES